MRARSKRLPGQPGTKALLKIYGERLVCVRYRYDSVKRRRYKTVELIVEEAEWDPPPVDPDPDAIVYIYVAWGEIDIGRQVKAAGGVWHARYRLWALPYARVAELNLLDRVREPPKL